MASIFIHSKDKHLCAVCRAYIKAFGHTETTGNVADVAIVDLDYGKPSVTARYSIYISHYDHRRESSESVLHLVKPVDADVLMERVLDLLQ